MGSRVGMRYRTLFFFLFFGLHLICRSQDLAFPGAEGFGKYTTGGRGGAVLVVSNLNDSGPGSFRAALESEGPRIVVFATSGTILLESELKVNNGDLTIAGQSAPGSGITVRNYPIKVSADNVIIRYIRSRMGDVEGVQDDAISIIGHKNIIVDHCTFSWGTDECATFYDNEWLTVQYCMITESLNKSVHKKGEHGYGGIWGGKKASFHHNLFAHHKSRNPRFNGSRYHKQPAEEIVDFRNNVIYNWQENNSYGGEKGQHNVVSNYYKPGPATRSKKDKILDPYEPFGQFYVEGNVLADDDEVTKDNWEGVNVEDDEQKLVRLDNPVSVTEIPETSAREAFDEVLNEAGASLCRDEIDLRIVREARSGTATFGTGIIDTPDQVGGWPVLKQGKASKDTDQDGMPDKWEKRKHLNKKKDDSAEIGLMEHYTNIEVYLNELVQD